MSNKVPIDPYEPKKHYARHRRFVMADGKEHQVLTTRYTYELALRKKRGPRGGKRYERFARFTYYYEGKFYKNVNTPVAYEKFVNELQPISGMLWDAHELQSIDENIPVLKIWCDNGEPYRADSEEFGTVWTRSDGIEELEGWLGLNKKARRSPKVA